MRFASVLAAALLALLLSACGSAAAPATAEAEVTGHLQLDYATQYTVDHRSDGTSLVTIGDADRYLLVPKERVDEVAPAQQEGVTVITTPVEDVYLAASSAMDFFVCLDALDSVRMTSTKAQDWSLDEVVQALEDGSMTYVGKYSAPDYEQVLSRAPDVAIESTMVYHAPEVAERLRDLGIPVLIERSSYETTPMGRLEWIKLYGLLTDRLAQAQEYCAEQTAMLAEVQPEAGAQKPTVAFFSISANGHAVVRKPGDYVSRMIAMAGGCYFLDDDVEHEDNALSTMNMEMETFYAAARDADIIIYNSAIDAELKSIEDLVRKEPRLADFAAVQSGNVWCTGKDLYQRPTCVAQLVVQMSQVFAGTAGDGSGLEYLYRVGSSATGDRPAWQERTGQQAPSVFCHAGLSSVADTVRAVRAGR